MNRDHEHPADPLAPAPELPAAEPPPTITSLEIEQVIERVSARYIADLQALKKQLRPPLPHKGSERLETHPSEPEQQDTLPAQTETARISFPEPEIPVSPRATAPTPQAAPAQQGQFAQAAVPDVRPQHPRLTWGERLQQKGWSLNSLYWAVIWVVAMLIGLGIGALVAIMTAAG